MAQAARPEQNGSTGGTASTHNDSALSVARVASDATAITLLVDGIATQETVSPVELAASASVPAPAPAPVPAAPTGEALAAAHAAGLTGGAEAPAAAPGTGEPEGAAGTQGP